MVKHIFSYEPQQVYYNSVKNSEKKNDDENTSPETPQHFAVDTFRGSLVSVKGSQTPFRTPVFCSADDKHFTLTLFLAVSTSFSESGLICLRLI